MKYSKNISFGGGVYFAGQDICFVQRMWFFWLHPQIGSASIVMQILHWSVVVKTV